MVKKCLLLIAILLISCSEYSREFEIHYTNGKIRYKKFCSQCHGKNGEGYKELYPPLKNIVFKDFNLQQTICITKYGYEDTLTILNNGKLYKYVVPMPAMKELTPQDIAFLMTFMYSEYANKTKVFKTEEIKKYLEKCR